MRQRALLASLAVIVASCMPLSAEPRPQARDAREKILVGAYYFAGWYHSKEKKNGTDEPTHYLRNPKLPPDEVIHKPGSPLDGRPNDWRRDELVSASGQRHVVASREPVIGWCDDSQEAIDQEIKLASEGGVDFFIFDWFKELPGLEMNYATDMFMRSPEKRRMKFAIMYIDTARFQVTANEWDATIDRWIGYFKDPQYLKVDGQPVMFGPESGTFRTQWGGAKGAAAALDRFREKARQAGFPDLIISGDVGAGGKNSGNFGHAADGYDFFTAYDFPHRLAGKGEKPFAELIRDEAELQWDTFSDEKWREWCSQHRNFTQVPYVPVITVGWDRRPILSGSSDPDEVYFTGATPELMERLFLTARERIEMNRGWRVFPRRNGRADLRARGQKMVVMYAWNEIGEGGQILPKKQESWSILSCIKRVFGPSAEAN